MFIITILVFALQMYNLVLLVRVIMSWIPNLDRSNPLIQMVYDATEPILKPIRDFLPPTSGFDFSPLVAFLIISVLMQILLAF